MKGFRSDSRTRGVGTAAASSRQKEMQGMNAKLVLIAFSALLSLSELASGGVILYVHFGDTVVNNESDIRSSYDPGGSSLTANIYLQLTGGSTLYGYRFSVRFNNADLDYQTRKQFRPGNFESNSKVEFENGGNPDPGPVSQSLLNPFAGNFLELRRFNGEVPFPDSFTETGFHKLATLNFAVRSGAALSPAAPLVLPGEFDGMPFNPPLFPNDVRFDKFFSVDNSYAPVFITVVGGSVSVSAVPEPASAVVVGALGVLALVRRKRRELLSME